jgi:hypothetical protein
MSMQAEERSPDLGYERISGSKVLQRVGAVPISGPSCPACAGRTFRVIRARRAEREGRDWLLAIRWACERCGHTRNATGPGIARGARDPRGRLPR